MKLIYTLAVAAMIAVAMPSTSFGASSAAPAAAPEVKLPYTFICPHCDMKITVKSKDEWAKSCTPCPCGTTNLGCYKAIKKK